VTKNVRDLRSDPTPNAFESGFLERIGERDEPPTGPEADLAGPWLVEEIPGAGFGVYRSGEGLARRFRPAAVFHDRPVALLAAAALPGTGRDSAFDLGLEPERAGFPVRDAGGQLAGHLLLFDEPLITALHVLESVLRSLESLANLLEAAGGLALERAGAILDQRFPEKAE
jgi:hypothetical protein